MFERHLKVWPAGLPRRLSVPERTIAANLEATARRFGERTATIFHGRTTTYAALNEQVERLAGYLQKRAGVARGDRVLLFMQNSPQFIVAYYAILRADAVVVPVSPMNRAGELEHLVADTGARVAFAGQELLEALAGQLRAGALTTVVAAAYADAADPGFDLPLPAPLDRPSPPDYGMPGVVRWAEALASGERADPPRAGPDDLAVIPYSSGTTGRPRGCMHTHRTVMTTIVGGIAWNPMSEQDVSLVALPLFHVTGMQNSMNAPIHVGGSLVVMVRWDRRVAAELIRRHRVTRWRSISTMAIDLVTDPDAGRYDLSSLRAIGGGGAAMPAGIADRLKALTGCEYVEGYGLSETMAATHTNPIARPRRQCLGVPLFEVDSRILEIGTDRQLGPDQPGELVIDAPQVFKGYWNDPEGTRAAFLELEGRPFFRTGDIAYYDEEGYFYLVDRLKRMINCAGLKVWPAEVETLMHRHPAIAEVCVVAAPDERRGESVKAYVALRAEMRGQVGEAEILAWCRGEMAAYKCPRTVAFLDALPRSPTGKLQWKELQDRERRGDAP